MASLELFVVAWLLAALALAATALGAPSPTAAQNASRVSIASDGGQGDGASSFGGVSPNGRFVVFPSEATNLVPGDTNGKTDVFRRDLKSGQTVRISLNSDGVQGNGRSFAGGVSRDGRLVLFWSHATNLVPGDTNQVFDVFVRDLRRGTTRRVSVSSDGVEGNSGAGRGATLDPSGRFVAIGSFASNMVAGDTNEASDVFLRDLVRGTTTRLTNALEGGETNGDSSAAAFVGRSVLVQSRASNLVAGDTNATDDIFLVRWR